MRTIKSCLLAVCLSLGGYERVHGDKPFSYLPQSEVEDDSAYGLENWDKVDPSQYFVDWERFYSRSIKTNQCSWEPDTAGHQQSPIDISNWGKCDKEKDDKVRRHSMMKSIFLVPTFINSHTELLSSPPAPARYKARRL
jgi:hypothetical protein